MVNYSPPAPPLFLSLQSVRREALENKDMRIETLLLANGWSIIEQMQRGSKEGSS